ncbi:helix-turn-helix transcriptional regulator [Pseudoalteromonas sp. T1lg65]|uniref:helix-turn-helix transcriptional regulator n=1 Tax=Pseudoalteromonas sp. T1lg65 TaxID=2077101 RepID=UPI003F79A332
MDGNILSTQLRDNLLLCSGLDSRFIATSHNKPIASGRLSFISLSDDLQLHICDYIEQQQASNCAEVSPSVNITLLLAGQVEFRVNSKYYHFDARFGPVAFANIVAQQEPFTRYFQTEQHVHKLTLSVSKSWLQERLDGHCEQLFQLSKVLTLPVSSSLLSLATQLQQVPISPNLTERLRCEGLAIQWLSSLLTELIADSHHHQAAYRLPPDSDIEAKKNRIVDLMNSGHSIEQVAKELAMSLSSLSRFFKRHFDTTPKQYIKLANLNKARHALLVEGLSIGEAAYLAHYDHTSNFIAAFKKHFGITPMQFVKMHRSDPN